MAGLSARMGDFVEYVAVRTLQGVMEATAIHRSPVGKTPFFDTALFPWVPDLEARAEEIIAEYGALASRLELPAIEDLTPFNSDLSNDQRWRLFVVRDYHGHAAALARELCPRTIEALDQIPGVRMAFFSVLEPGKRIPPHRGPYSGILRCHIGIQIPKDAHRCRIRVSREWRHWERGKVMLFDDSFDHEVENLTDERRVVLFIDFVRPLDAPFRWLNRFYIDGILDRAAFADVMTTRTRDWEKTVNLQDGS